MLPVAGRDFDCFAVPGVGVFGASTERPDRSPPVLPAFAGRVMGCAAGFPGDAASGAGRVAAGRAPPALVDGRGAGREAIGCAPAVRPGILFAAP